jgi:hypothetical protein
MAKEAAANGALYPAASLGGSQWTVLQISAAGLFFGVRLGVRQAYRARFLGMFWPCRYE